MSRATLVLAVGMRLLLSSGAEASGAELIRNGSFELNSLGSPPGSGFVTLPAGSTVISDWNVTRGGIDYISSYWQPSNGSFSLDLNAGIGSSGGISQSISTMPGSSYLVQFNLAGNPGGSPTVKTLRVQAADQWADFSFDVTGNAYPAMGWARCSWVFTARQALTVLEFWCPGNSGYGAALDSVSVVPVADRLSAALLAYLPFDGDFQDRSGNGLHGSPSGNVHTVDGAALGRSGQVAAFDGSDDYLVLPHVPFDNRPFAVSCWIQMGTHVGYGFVEQFAADEASEYLHLVTRDGNRPFLGFYINDLQSPAVDALDTQWHHLVFQYTGAKQQIWIDGRLSEERAATPYLGKAGQTLVGHAPQWTNVTLQDLQGYLDEFRIYSRALTADDIHALMALPASTQMVYANDFQAPVGQEWSSARTDITPVWARRFLGQFGNDKVSLSLTGLPAHTFVTAAFDLLILRSWDGNNTQTGPNLWSLSAKDGPILLRTTFSQVPQSDYRQAYPHWYGTASHAAMTGAVEANVLGYNDRGDAVYRLCFTFPHTGSSLDLDFASWDLEALDNESWGLDNVEIRVGSSPDSDGDGLPDEWERKYFRSPTAALATEDPDHDGFNNLQEYNLGTDPSVPSGTYYVDPTNGSDAQDGLAITWDGTHGPKATIQAAIDAAAPDRRERVVLAAGTYRGNGNRDVEFRGKAITVQSANPADAATVAATIVDCQGSASDKHRGFKFHAYEGPDSVLDGVTITNGYAPDESFGWIQNLGGAISILQASPVICNCVFVRNTCSGCGNCVSIWGGNPTIINCEFARNVGPQDGPISCWYSSGTTVDGCRFIGNTTNYIAGAVHSWYSNMTFRNCLFANNASDTDGGGINFAHGELVIDACVFDGNTTRIGHGGAFCSYDSDTIVRNSILVRNASPSGAGIYQNQGSLDVQHCTIAGSARGCGMSTDGGQLSLANSILWDNPYPEIELVSMAGPASVTVSYSSLTDGQNSIAADSGCTLDYGEGNLAGDPLLRQDGHLLVSSPCRAAADPAGAAGVTSDVDGEPRPSSSPADIGADQVLDSDGDEMPDWWESRYFSSATAADPAGDPDHDEVINLAEYEQGSDPLTAPKAYHVDGTSGNDANDGSSWATAKKTVQAGLGAAAAGEQVWVAAGTYTGSIKLKDGVGLYGGFVGGETSTDLRDWRTNATVLDGAGASFHFVEAPMGAAAATRVDGFIVRNSYDYGIYCNMDSCPTIANCTITANGESFSGSPDGGGIYCGSRSSPVILNNTITGNMGKARGGGIYCGSYSRPLIANNTITANTAFSGGGIYCGGNSAPLIANNTLVHNDGDALYYWYSSPTIVNNIIAMNSYGICGYGESSIPVLRNNCVYANKVYNYSGLADPTGADGNLSVDPGLAGAACRNLHLQPGSPCIDAGDDSVARAGWRDMDSKSRVLGTHVDIGADESDGRLWPVPNVVVRVASDGDDGADGASWASAKRTVQAGIDAAAARGGEVWVKAGTYRERISLRVYTHIYGGFAGTEAERSTRNRLQNVTALDGEHAGTVVSIQGTGRAPSTVDGFTIRNGYGSGVYCNECPSLVIANNTIAGNEGSYGAGIDCSFSSPVIVNNTITGNEGYYGGGIYYDGASSPVIASNMIAGNRGGIGGGILCRSSSSSTIVNNTIAGNEAYFGGGISDQYGASVIANNTVVGNIILECGAIEKGPGGPFVNNIVAFNSSGAHMAADTALRNNCVYGNADYDYLELPDPTGTSGNVSADPGIVRMPSPGPDGLWGTADDDYGDLRLLPFSPCIDAGSNADVPIDAVDLDGDGDTAEPLPVDLAGVNRFLDDPQVADTGVGTAPIVDMGAYERCRPVGDVDGDWLTDVADLLWLVESFGKSQGDTEFDPRCDFNGDGMVDVEDLLDLVQNFGR